MDIKENEQPEYILKNISEKPSVAGTYNLQIDGVFTMLPLFLEFDGTDWINVKSVVSLAFGDEQKIFYYEQVPKNIQKLKI